MHVDGETDVRGAYCAASVAVLLGAGDVARLFEGTAAWIGRCQTFDGGVGAVPGTEAHGGYAFCGLAAAHLLGRPDVLDHARLLRWAAARQMRLEGGFQGRPNKLVDGCYSFWVGGVFPLLAQGGDLFSRAALVDWLTLCCQLPEGGLRDKPGKHRDYYHTCYCLSGLSSAQHSAGGMEGLLMADGAQLVETHPLFNVAAHKARAAQAYYGSA